MVSVSASVISVSASVVYVSASVVSVSASVESELFSSNAFSFQSTLCENRNQNATKPYEPERLDLRCLMLQYFVFSMLVVKEMKGKNG